MNRYSKLTALFVSLLIGQLATAAGQVVITEFMADPDSIYDTRGEYIELLNSGTESIDLEGWTLRDEDSNSAMLPSYELAPGALVIVTKDKEAVIAEWFEGEARPEIVEVGFGTLANGEDELVLQNSEGETEWRLAYGDDASSGVATYLTGVDFSISEFGVKGEPGIVRVGEDNGMTDFLGYEDAVVGTDGARESAGGDIGSPLSGHYSEGS